MRGTHRGWLLLSITGSLTTVLTPVTRRVLDWIEKMTGENPDRGELEC